MNSFLSTCILLFLVIDPLGNLVTFSTLLRRFDAARRRRIVIRECIIGGVILVLFSLCGEYVLSGLALSESSLRITGGIMLFLIAIKMLFKDGTGGGGGESFGENTEPFIVPFAMPLFAGPAAIATIVLRSTQYPDQRGLWLLAIAGVSALATVILVFGDSILHRIGAKGLNAMERLMGLILTILSVQMILDGITVFVKGLDAA